jgi:hypothetical protein
VGRIVDKVKEFVKELSKEIEIQEAILFGSRARGDELVDSDLDLIIVSKDFKDVFFTDRPKIAYKHWKHNIALEILCLTPEEFKERKSKITIIREAVKEGIKLI